MNNEPSLPKKLPAWLDRIAAGLAILTALAGLLRIALVRPLAEALNEVPLKYFAVAGGLLLLRKVKSLSFGDTKVEMQELKQAVETLKDDVTELGEETKTNASVAQHLGSPSSSRLPEVATEIDAQRLHGVAGSATEGGNPWDRSPGNAKNDPWKGVFGKTAERRHRRLRAEVAESRSSPGWYRVRVWVASANPNKYPLAGRVRFFLHNEFSHNRPFVFVKSGQAELRLHSYGAFTVGALADDGNTELELDLSEDESLPKQFREVD